jgi:hypothetical protein
LGCWRENQLNAKRMFAQLEWFQEMVEFGHLLEKVSQNKSIACEIVEMISIQMDVKMLN